MILRPPRSRRRGARPRSGALAAIARADQAALHLLRRRGHGPRAEATMRALASAGEHGAVWAAIGTAGALADRRRRKRWLIAGATGPASIGINFAVKVAVGRERPLLTEHPRLGRAPTELSFPSAHATSSLAAATALGRVEPRMQLPLLALAAAICVGRPYLGMHWPSDVLVGAALGFAIGSLVPGVAEPPPDERLIDLMVEADTRGGRDGRPEAQPASAGPAPA